MTAGSRQPFDLIDEIGIVPVVVVDDASSSSDLAAALVEGGLPIAEITLRTDAAVSALRAFAEQPGILVGAGTVLTADQVDLAVDAGARFVVSPGFSTAVVRRAQELGVPVIPGVSSATDVQAAVQEGVGRVKLFPAHQLGGPAMIRALSDPFPDMRFLPSGGVSLANAEEYLAIPSVFALGGSWMVRRSLLQANDLSEVTRLCTEAVASIATARTALVGGERPA
ncbi:bifunctional 4-hydroxy-2-oxoglutarate aldolase/2-dehydro-3-deoxy-phosphogluconate aldolase [Arthrobacter agilis]|uniref:bifunctional 4-hydroxy-2-oxoglutarate aldolase/2-dehydro-3-deoxy-phosphogluconate aldolase n=1 Tax=Arthrobacter agilis TaxID=37921 RepID=UPI002365DFD1|nr:bifunctional 4-hydroxy-2-oxoglutarate aldolase/2-dehydro-3-deoxy-phosphogluconate aldolase [Arthrobacter agilis]WDF34047.1 bifunctional 4-hydroxy-2-oxoglutarate aldolase/2-dehydro-3-deoxy-phosphogluconate aldolase [Arthrobacter agilis]